MPLWNSTLKEHKNNRYLCRLILNRSEMLAFAVVNKESVCADAYDIKLLERV